MKEWKLVWIMVITATMIHPFKTSAQEQPEKAYKLEEVVVSATRTEIPVFDAPQSVTVITNEEIISSPFNRVEDIVRSIPGVYNFRHYNLHTNGIVSPLKMRGVGNNRILMLVDGVPQNDNFNNAIAWMAWGYIPKETIKRIEIVRGPTSALYGSEGLGGVIHIITKKPMVERQTSIRGMLGNANSYDGSGFHSQTIKNFGLMVSGGYEKSDGFYMVEYPESYEIKRCREVGKVLGKAAYKLTPSSNLTFTALYYDHKTGKGRNFFYDELTLNQYWMNYTNNGSLIDLKGLLYLNQIDQTVFQDTVEDNYSSLLRIENIPSTTWGADFQGSIPVNLWTNITVGTAYKGISWNYNDEYITSDRNVGAKGKQQYISPFTNVNFSLLDGGLIVNLGARYDWIETSNGANWDSNANAGLLAYDNKYDTYSSGSFSPKIGVAWHPDNVTTIRLSGGKGFRAPSLLELHKVHVRGGGTYYRKANPALEPEKIWSYDLGTERLLMNNLWGKLSLYKSFAKDYIGDRLLGTGKISGDKIRYEYKLDNISKVDIHGIETEFQWYPKSNLTFFTNYTYNISKVSKDENNAELEGNYLTDDPRHNYHIGVRYHNPNIINIELVANYYDDIYFDSENTLNIGSYWTVDVSVSRTFLNQYTFYVNVENIFGKKYPIFLSPAAGDTIAPGIIGLFGVEYEF